MHPAAQRRDAHEGGQGAEGAGHKERVEWVDYAKGICIFAVVTMYSTHHVQQMTHATGWMQYVVDFAKPFRMPDFFLISGLFVWRVLGRQWRTYINTKVLYFFYFYAIWVTFRFLYTDVHAQGLGDGMALLRNYLWLYVEPPSGPLWFIYLLALFFIAVRLVRSWPPVLVLAGAVALHVANPQVGMMIPEKFSHYFVFFYSGFLFARPIFRMAEQAQLHPRLSTAALLAWFAANAGFVAAGWSELPGVTLLLGFAGACAIMLLGVLLARFSSMQWLRYLGKHSIVVYLGFVVPLALMRHVILAAAARVDIGTVAFIVTLASVLGAVLMYWALRNTPLRYLYARPAWLSASPSSPRRFTQEGTQRAPAPGIE